MNTHDAIQSELLPGERLIWAAQPSPAALARTRWPIAAPGLFLMLFASFWLTFTFDMLFSGNNRPPIGFLLIFPLVGFAALTAGLAMLLSPPWYGRKAKRMAYAVTDSRVLIVEPGRVQSFEPGDIQQLVRTDKGDGSGNLIIREEQGNLMLAMHTFGAMANRKIGFYGVPDVRAAETAIRDLKRSVG